MMNIKHKILYAFIFFMTYGGFSVSAQGPGTKKASGTEGKSDMIYITDNKHIHITFKDNHFNDWLTKQTPKHKYLQSSLEIENLQYATEWNRRVGNPDFDSNIYVQQIDYQIKPKLHYGMDVNYKLFMYFKFFEEKYEKLLLKS